MNIKNRNVGWTKLFSLLVLVSGMSGLAQSHKVDDHPKVKKNISNFRSESFDARRWKAVELSSIKVSSERAFLEFAPSEKRFTGNAGCNRMFGRFETNGTRIKFFGIGQTRALCVQADVMKLERNFIRALQQATRFTQTSDSLLLYAGNNLLVKFSGSTNKISGNQNANSMTLENKKWILTATVAKSELKLQNPPFLVFDVERGSVGGETGCNAFGGSYKTDGKNINITNIISTFRACLEEERMSVEREFLRSLQKINRYEMRAETLNLYQGDNLLLTFDAREKK